MNCRIPKLLIQPLIENSVYHGLETKKGSGTIELIIKSEDNMLLVIVADDGTGIPQDTLLRLQQALDSVKSSSEEGHEESSAKIGLLNVHKRIWLLYGDEYGLEVSSIQGEGTTAVLKLPLESAEGAG